jgi:hypothetical protein
MSVTITLSDEQAEAIRAKAAAEGLSLENWFQKIAGLQSAEPVSAKIRRIWEDLPPDARERLPADGASQVDHYVYGLPKSGA